MLASVILARKSGSELVNGDNIWRAYTVTQKQTWSAIATLESS